MTVVCRGDECDGEIDPDHDYSWAKRCWVCPDCGEQYEDWQMGDMINDARESAAEEQAIGQAEYIQDLRDQGWEL